jgi:putative aldouronate transport system substrate-binding protein
MKTYAFLWVGLCLAAPLATLGAQAKTIDIPFKATKPVSFTMLFSDNPAYPSKTTWTIFDDIKKATNVEVKTTIVPMSEYNNKRSLLVSSGDAPLIMPKTYPGTEVPFVASGQILPISDYVKDMPNYSAAVKAWGLEDDLKTITQRDGKYYVLPELHQSFTQDYSLALRTDVLKKHKIAVPNTWAEVESVLRQLKALYPDVTPYSERWQLGAVFSFGGPAFGVGGVGIKTPAVNWNNGQSFFFDRKADKFVFYPTMNEYKGMLEYFARLVKDGLLDRESATQTDDQAVGKFINGKSFLISCNGQELNNYRQKMEATLGAGNFEVTRINLPAGPAGAVIAGSRLENGIMFSAKAAQDPEFKTLLKFVDWLWYSYSGQELTKWGTKGATFVVNKGIYAPAAGYQFPAFGFNGKETDKDLRREFGYGSGVFVLTYGGPDALAYSYMSQENKDFTALVNKTRTVLPPNPPLLYTEDQLESQNMIQSPLMDYVFQMTYKFILGQADLKTGWADYVKQCQTKGADKLTQTANAVYQETKRK